MGVRNKNYPELPEVRFIKTPQQELKRMLRFVERFVVADRNQWSPDQRAEWELYVESLFRKPERTPQEKLIIDANARIMQLERHLTYQKKICRLLQDERLWTEK